MTQRTFTVQTSVGLLAIAVTSVAWSGALEFRFVATNFTNSTSLTNDYWGLRLEVQSAPHISRRPMMVAR